MTGGTCGCCELPPTTPLVADNRPGLSAVAFRTGTYGTFRLAMLRRIARSPGLGALRTRQDDDYAVTLLDLWATVADILTFYQERIANEGFLRTARLRDSILRLASLLDYRPRPGVAATTRLAFTLDAGASLRIPVGLRVQSVPADKEKPRIYETLEPVRVDARLNRLRLLPAPEGFNPLARGSTSAILAPGAGAIPVPALSRGDRFVLVSLASGQVEELVVRGVTTEEERAVLAWSGPIQGSSWDVTSRAHAVGRTFRVFGHDAPAQYMEAVETPAGSGKFIWTRRTFSSWAYTPPTANVLELDATYDGIVAGSRLLICQSSRVDLVTVTAVGQDQATFLATGAATSPVQGTVTRVTVSELPAIADRRTTAIREVTSPRVRFWGYRHPPRVTGTRVYVAGRRIDAETIEVGRAIQGRAYTAGVRLPLAAVDAGRQVMLLDPDQPPTGAVISAAELVGLHVTVNPTPDDFTTALELRLDPESAQKVVALRSAELPSVPSLTSTLREMSVGIGMLAPRLVTLGAAPASIQDAAAKLHAALTGSLPPVPEFTGSRVLGAGNSLLVLPGVPGAAVRFEPTPGDPTTAGELGLTAPDAFPVDGLLSGDLSSFPTLSSALRELSVTFGPVGPRIVSLSPAPTSLSAARTRLATALAAADPSPAFATALVLGVGSRMLILPGTGGAPAQDYLALTLRADEPLRLGSSTAVLLGNVGLASDGETVRDEVLGDGDASVPFQKFALAKKPLTYTPAAGPGAVESTLRITVGDVLWSEAPTLFGRGPADRVYTTRLANDGTVTVGFGDGRNGACLPSGRGNVVADYRQGSGLAGRVGAASLRSPLDLPVGLKSVSNPAPATGGADAESIKEARENAPNTVRTFGRAVSLRDFEDLARSSGEVAKALATWVWSGEGRAVHVTVGAQRGLPFTDADLARIHASLDAERDPNHALLVANFTAVPVVVTATLRVQATHVASKVAAAARSALLGALSFDSLRFGQPLALSELYRVLQEVPGVESADVDLFQFKDQSAAFLESRGATADPVQRTLRIFAARPNPDPTPPAVLPAELAFVETPPEDVQIATSGGRPD